MQNINEVLENGVYFLNAGKIEFTTILEANAAAQVSALNVYTKVRELNDSGDSVDSALLAKFTFFSEVAQSSTKGEISEAVKKFINTEFAGDGSLVWQYEEFAG